MRSERIYLDNAATSWPKPPAVYDAVDRYQRELGAPAGRGGYGEAAEVDATIQRCRRRVAKLLGAEDPRRIIFTCSGTDSLNLAILGVVRPGDHVVTTEVEHNSVLRPLRHLEETQHVEVTRVPCSGRSGQVDPAAIERAIRPDTKLVVVTHASNVTGCVQPVAEIGGIAKSRGAIVLVDAAQTLGHWPIDVQALNVDLLAAPGHKGLLGPLGTGVLYVADGVDAQLDGWRKGGTGTESSEDRQPQGLPDKYESGNLNVPGIFGLDAGCAFLEEQGIETIEAAAHELVELLRSGLRPLAGVTLEGDSAGPSVSVVSMTIEGYDPREVAAILDSTYRIQVRAGFHCAPLMHRQLGTVERGGTVRLSIGPFNTSDQIEQAIAAISEIAGAG